MGARRLAIPALVIGMIGGASAWAGPTPAPAPTSSVTTYLTNGTALPATPVSAAWSAVTPGCAGSLDASGPAASGTTTVITGDFVSRPFRAKGGLVAKLSGEMGGRKLLQPLPEGFSLSLRVRDLKHGWSSWFTMTMTTQPATPPALFFTVSGGGGIGIMALPPGKGHRAPLQQIELRVRDEVTSTGTVDDQFRVQAGC